MSWRMLLPTAAIGASVCAWLALLLFTHLPPPALNAYGEGTVLRCREGWTLRVQLGDQDLDVRPVAVGDMSPWAVQALIAVEDKRFPRHRGVDPIAIARATVQNLWYRRRISGASTITTQVVRMAEPRPRTPFTKIIEAVKALRLERRRSKASLIEHYLNRAPFGGNLNGLEAAGQVYFGKAAGDLTLAEAAMLAGLPQAPARLRPDRNPEAARLRQQAVLARMAACGFITREERKAALRQPMPIGREARPFEAPHFCDLVLARHGPQRGSVHTTLDRGLQGLAEQVVARHHSDLRRQGVRGMAIVILEVPTGAVRALVGSPDYFDREQSGMVNGALAARSPGSALKPLIYAVALDQGLITPGRMLDDSPMRFADSAPVNFDQAFRGPVTVRDALVQSLNIPALRVTAQVGVQAAMDRMHEMGLPTLDRPAADYGLGLALGGAEVTLLELVNAYACFAREGVYKPYRLLETAEEPPGRRLFSPETAYMLADMLSGAERSLDVFGHIADAHLPRFAWKTGTSSGFRDAWTVAWNPEFVVGVWMGNPDGAGAAALVGGRVAAPVAGDLFRQLPVRAGGWYPQPAGLRQRETAEGVREWYIPGISLPVQDIGTKPTALRIVTPADGSTYRMVAAPHLDQTVSLQAAGAGSEGELHWFANGVYAGTGTAGRPVRWPLQPGEWTLVCVSPDGPRAQVRIRVRPKVSVPLPVTAQALRTVNDSGRR